MAFGGWVLFINILERIKKDTLNKQIIFIILILSLYSCMNNNTHLQSDSIDSIGLEVNDSNSITEISPIFEM